MLRRTLIQTLGASAATASVASVASIAAPPGLAHAQAASSAAGTGAVAGRDWFIFLESGKPTPDDKAAVAQMQRGHLDNFKRLFDEGRLFAAGPMRDPGRVKRGIVVVKAPSREALVEYFKPDVYVSEGYLALNAQPAEVRQALHHTGIDASGIEEHRIALIGRAERATDAERAAVVTHLQRGLDMGAIGAWYRLEAGPVAEVVFSRGTDETALRRLLAEYPGVHQGLVRVDVWPQWLGKGVLR